MWSDAAIDLKPPVVTPSARVDTRLVIVCLVPLAQALVNNQWLFTFEGAIDPWIYFGYFNDFSGHLRAFPNTYYGSRLSWLVPGMLAYRLFSPIVANYVLHLLLCEVALVSLYLTLRWTTRRDVAFLVTVLTAAYPFFLWSMGWDYVDGPGIAYYLVAMCLVTYATQSRWHGLFVGAAGAAFAGAIHTNVIWLAFTPAVLAYALSGLQTRTLRTIGTTSFSFAAGAVVLTALLGAVNASVTGEWLFFLPSFSIALGLTSRNSWKVAGYAWLARTNWLAAPAIVFVLAIAFLARTALRRGEPSRACVFFAVQHVAFVVIFVALEFAGLPMLETQSYSSYLIPATSLAFGAILYSAGPRRVAYDGFIVTAAAIVVATAPYYVPLYVWAYEIVPQYSVAWAAGFMTLGALALAVGNTASTVAFLLAVAIANIEMADNGTFTWNHAVKNVVFRAVADTLPIIRSCDPGGEARFWYNAKERNGSVFRASASTQLFEYRLISDAFPSLTNRSGSPVIPDSGDRILILSGQTDRWRLAADIVRRHGLTVNHLWSKPVSESPISFEMTCVQVTARHADADTPTVVPVDQFMHSKTAATAVTLEPDGRSIRVTTNRSMYDWQTLSDPIPVDGGIDYVLDFTARIDRGGMGVTVIDDRSAVLATRNWCTARAERNAGLRFHAERGSKIRVVFSNCGFPTPRVSLFSVKDVRIWRLSSD